MKPVTFKGTVTWSKRQIKGIYKEISILLVYSLMCPRSRDCFVSGSIGELEYGQISLLHFDLEP